ncbi:MAG: hypothetical protein ACKPHU_21155, partial [Planctomycetaceae bacterium]
GPPPSQIRFTPLPATSFPEIIPRRGEESGFSENLLIAERATTGDQGVGQSIAIEVSGCGTGSE